MSRTAIILLGTAAVVAVGGAVYFGSRGGSSASGPTVSVSPSSVAPGAKATVTVTNETPGHLLYFYYVDSSGTKHQLNTNPITVPSSGSLSATATIPATLAAGQYQILMDDATASVETTGNTVTVT